jgi:hypothetical protein
VRFGEVLDGLQRTDEPIKRRIWPARTNRCRPLPKILKPYFGLGSPWGSSRPIPAGHFSASSSVNRSNSSSRHPAKYSLPVSGSALRKGHQPLVRLILNKFMTGTLGARSAREQALGVRAPRGSRDSSKWTVPAVGGQKVVPKRRQET